MGFVLDQIFKKIILEGPETVSSDFYSPHVSIDGTEENFSVSFTYENGNSVDMVFWLQASNDGVNFSNITGSDQAVTDNSGSHIWDVSGSGVQFIRIFIEVLDGTIDVSDMLLNGNRRH